MAKRWIRIHRVLHGICAGTFLAAWALMVHMVGFIKTQCNGLPWLVETTYSLSTPIILLVCIPVAGWLLLGVKPGIAAARGAAYGSGLALLLGFSAAAFLVYTAYRPIFDCGWGIPLEVRVDGGSAKDQRPFRLPG